MTLAEEKDAARKAAFAARKTAFAKGQGQAAEILADPQMERLFLGGAHTPTEAKAAH